MIAAHTQKVKKKETEIKVTPEYISFKNELISKASTIKDEPGNSSNHKKIDDIVNNILKLQLSLMVTESLFPTRNNVIIVVNIINLQSELEELSPALLEKKIMNVL